MLDAVMVLLSQLFIILGLSIAVVVLIGTVIELVVVGLNKFHEKQISKEIQHLKDK
jgi:hypothetical protein